MLLEETEHFFRWRLRESCEDCPVWGTMTGEGRWKNSGGLCSLGSSFRRFTLISGLPDVGTCFIDVSPLAFSVKPTDIAYGIGVTTANFDEC